MPYTYENYWNEMTEDRYLQRCKFEVCRNDHFAHAGVGQRCRYSTTNRQLRTRFSRPYGYQQF